MTLLISLFAAIICSIIWYTNPRAAGLKLSVLCFMFWGASLMWFVDAVFEYIEMGAAYFNASPADMLNDLALGISVVALAMLVWIIYLFIKDPEGRIRKNS